MANEASFKPRSGWAVAWPYALLLAGTFVVSYASMEILSGVRAYVGGEGLYSKAQKEAVAHLSRYVQSGNDDDFHAYERAIAVPMGDHEARLALSKPEPDLDIAAAGFVDGQNSPSDVGRMIFLFRWGRWFGPMRHAVDIWVQGDAYILEIDRVAREARAAVLAGQMTPAGRTATMERLRELDLALTPLEDEFSATLGEGARLLQLVLLSVLAGTVCALGALAYAVYRTRLRERTGYETTLRASEDRYRSVFESSLDPVLIAAADGAVIEANPAACRLFGYLASEFAVLGLAALVAPKPDEDKAGLVARLQTGEFQGSIDFLKKDGSRFIGEVSTAGFVDLKGGRRCSVVVRDATARRLAEAALRESEVRLRAVIEQSPVSVAIAHDTVTVEVNAVYLKTFGYRDADEVRGRPLLQQVAPQCRAAVEERIARRASGEPVETEYETIGLRKDGSQFPIYVSAKRLHFKDGPLTIAFIIDISRQKSTEEEIRRLAFYDHLTELPNRRMLQERLRQARAAGSRGDRHGALLFIDLDDFKTLNDTLGHSTGDLLLQQVAARLRSCIREGDSVARMGGDEFVVILEGLSAQLVEAAQQAEMASNKILAALRPTYRLHHHDYHCTASIGATLFSGPDDARVDLVRQADIAMYQAKKAGRNSIRFFDPKMQDAIYAQTAMEGELRQALERHQFELHYQVQVDSAQRPIGAEALIRWMHPARGAVSPAQFIPLAERTGLILPIGGWVLESACAQLSTWAQDPRARRLALCVNVSAKQFHVPTFARAVRDVVREHGIDPERLVLELTESLLLEDIEDTIETMNALREVGVRFSLDDFGTGYSSLQYLKRLPLHQLKIDQSFVRDIAVDASDLAIVQTIVAMARSLNLNVIAEGVETEEQHRLLLARGCEQFQGYLFGRPVAIAEFERELARPAAAEQPGR